MRNSLWGAQIQHKQEGPLLIFTSLQAFFVGAFVSLFLIGAHVLFLQSWEPGNLPQAFILSGFWGILIFTFYTQLSSRINLSVLVGGGFLLVFAVNLALYLNYDQIVNYQVEGVPLMFPFVLAFPLTFLVLILFRRSLRYSLTPREHRQFYPVLRTFLMFGIILASYALVGMLFIHWDMLLILEASTACIGMATLLQPVVNLFRQPNTFQHPTKRTGQLRSKFYEYFYTRYTFLLLLFVLISSATGFILHFHFVEITRENYSNTIGLAKFFGFFYGTMFLFIYMVERFLIRKILYTYDSPFSLVLIPVVLTIACIFAVFVDLLIGSSTVISRVSFGFLMIAILKVGYETMFEVIELPSFRVLFRTLDLRFSSSVIVRFEGSFRMVSLVIAGLLLTGLFYLHLRKNIYVNLMILVFTLLWIPIGIMLVRAYQKALRETIRRLKTSKRAIVQELLNTDEKIHHLVNLVNDVKSIYALSILEKLEPLSHERHVMSKLGTDSARLLPYLLQKIDEHALMQTLPRMKELETSAVTDQIPQLKRLIHRFEIRTSAGHTRESISQLVNSKTLTDRILAAELIGSSQNQDWSDFLMHLQRDFEPEVKLASVKAMSRMANPDHSYILIGYLSTPAYYPYAFESLVKIGDPAIPYLEQVFLQPDADNQLLSRIVRIYGKIGSQAAIDNLLTKLENQNRMVVHQTLLALREAKFQATPGNINRVLNDIVRLINIMSWNFAAYASIGSSSRYSLVREAFEAEIAENYDTFYHLLSLAYNPTSIGNIKNMLLEGSDTDISFAIELLDQIVNEEIKQVFFPVVENISIQERFKQLQYYFQAIRENPDELILDTVNRDFNSLSLYAKACALYSLPSLKKKEASQELIASVFHPNQLIRETAAYVMEQLDPILLESVFSRLDTTWVTEIRTSLSRATNGIPHLLIHRIRFIKQCPKMQSIPEDILLEVAKLMEVTTLKQEEEFLIKRDDVHYAFLVIVEGIAQVKISSGKVFTFGKNDIIYSDIFVEDNTYSLRALSDLSVFSMEQEALNSLMFDFVDFRNAILNLVEDA